MGNWRLGLTGIYLFQKNGVNEKEDQLNHYVSKAMRLNCPSLGNMVLLSVIWNFQSGRQHQSSGNSFNNRDNDAGILKTE